MGKPRNLEKGKSKLRNKSGVSLESLTIEYNRAKNEGITRENYFKTRHLNIWVSSLSAWISDTKFKVCQRDLNREAYRNRIAFGGLDLSSKFDLSAWSVTVSPLDEGEPFKVFTKLYLPEDNIAELEKKHRAPYRQWAHEGHIILTPGNVIDFDYIERDITKDAEFFNLQGSGYDRSLQLE